MQMQVNLLPAKYQAKPQVRLWPVVLTLVLVMNLIVISAYWVFLQLDLAKINSEIHTLENDIDILQRRVDEAQWKADLESAVAVKSGFIETELSSYILWNPGMTAIERSMVNGLFIESVDFSSTGDINIGGIADSVKTAADFWGSLHAETGLEIIRMNYIEPHEEFIVTLQGWLGREVHEDVE